MIESYTIDEMTERWRVRLGFGPLRSDGPVERVDGIDVDAVIRERIADWYAGLLSQGPLEMLHISDISDYATIDKVRDGVVTVKLSPVVERVTSVRLLEWNNDATVITPESDPVTAMMQQSPMSRAGCVSPVAILMPDHRLMLYTTNVPKPMIESIKGVVRPADDSIVIDDSALASIPSSLV